MNDNNPKSNKLVIPRLNIEKVQMVEKHAVLPQLLSFHPKNKSHLITFNPNNRPPTPIVRQDALRIKTEKQLGTSSSGSNGITDSRHSSLSLHSVEFPKI